jgi:AraC-like DNA-binding protein
MARAASERRARVITAEHELGSETRATRRPDPRLRPLLGRDYIGFVQESARFESWLEPPRPALTLMLCLGEPLRTAADGTLPVAWAAGLSDSFELVEVGSRQAFVDLELTPLGAYVLLGRPVRELEGRVVALEDLYGLDGRELAERVRAASSWDERFDLVDTFLLRRAGAGPAPTPFVARAWSRLLQTAGNVRIGALAAELGASRRHLGSRFHEQVGLAPKAAARLLRFAEVRRRIESDPVRWADIAYECGYADQPHLNRDFRDFAGTTPTDFLARVLPAGGAVGDGIPFVQDGRRDGA